jgi:hypothetical protein
MSGEDKTRETEPCEGVSVVVDDIHRLILKNPSIAKLVRVVWIVLATVFLVGAGGARELYSVKNSIEDLDKHGGTAFESHAAKQASADLIIATKLGEISVGQAAQTKAMDNLTKELQEERRRK